MLSAAPRTVCSNSVSPNASYITHVCTLYYKSRDMNYIKPTDIIEHNNLFSIIESSP